MPWRRSRRAARGYIGLTTLSLLAASAATDALSDPSAKAARDDGTVRILLRIPLHSIDPLAVRTQTSSRIFANLCEALVRPVGGGVFEPWLAVEWRSADAGRWDVVLRPGVQFHDGRTMTADDVVASFRRAADLPGSQLADEVLPLRAIAAIDRRTVRFEGGLAEEVLLEALAAVPIVPAETPDELDTLVATGPYRVVRYRADESLDLERFEGYWGDLPPIERARFTFEVDGGKRVEALLADEVDLVAEVPAELVSKVEQQPGLWVASQYGTAVHLLLLNNSIAPLDDRRVREAIDLAIDRRRLAVGFFHNLARPTAQLSTPGRTGYVADLVPPETDPDAAAAMLRRAGYELPLEIPFHHVGTSLEVTEELKRQLEAGGFKVTLVESSPRRFLQDLKESKVPMSRIMMRVGSPEDQLGTLVGNPAGGDGNMSRYLHPEVDRLLEESRHDPTAAARAEALQELHRLLAEERPFIPLLAIMDLFGMRRDLEWEPSLSGQTAVRRMRWRDGAGVQHIR